MMGMGHLAGHPGERQQFVLLHGQRRADDLVDVAARAEGPARAAQHEHPDVAPVRQLGEQVTQVGVAVEGQGVELGGPVERDGRDPVRAREPEVVPLLRNRDRSAKGAHRVIRLLRVHDISVH
jgi:hypothetical protein